MKKILSIIALAIAFTLADNFSDNPEVNSMPPAVQKEQNKLCLHCGDGLCIYEQINAEIDASGGDGSDSDIYDAVKKVTKLRGVTDSTEIKNILAEYYL